METVRVDKWLWAVRFYKTRQLAQGAINTGKIQVNGARIKSSRNLKVGDKLIICKQQFTYEIEVLQLHDRRMSASLAQAYYQESQQSIENRENMVRYMKVQSLYTPKTDTKPDKKSRRKLIDMKKA